MLNLVKALVRGHKFPISGYVNFGYFWGVVTITPAHPNIGRVGDDIIVGEHAILRWLTIV